MKSHQQRYEEAVERNLRNLAQPRLGGFVARYKFKSLEEAKRIIGIRDRDTSYDVEVRQYVED